MVSFSTGGDLLTRFINSSMDSPFIAGGVVFVSATLEGLAGECSGEECRDLMGETEAECDLPGEAVGDAVGEAWFEAPGEALGEATLLMASLKASDSTSIDAKSP